MAKKAKLKNKKITKKSTPKKVVILKTKQKLPLIPEQPKQNIISEEEFKVLVAECGDDKDMALFYLVYLQNGQNASKTYKALHPYCSEQSCRVLGSRMLTKLAKVNKWLFLDALDLGPSAYLEKIKSGIEAKHVQIVNVRLKESKGKKAKIIYDTIETPDHSTQLGYMEKLGKILEFEGKENDGGTAVSVQVNTLINDKKKSYGI